MSFLYNEIYDELPKEILNTENKQANDFVSSIIKSAVPPKDYCPLQFSKSILVLRTKQREKPRRRKPKVYLSRAERTKSKSMKCPKTGWNYDEFEPLRKMWKQYMKRTLKNDYCMHTLAAIERADLLHLNTILARADYHGAEMTVIRSKNPTLVGLSGTCIMDTKNMFKLVSKDNICRSKKLYGTKAILEIS